MNFQLCWIGCLILLLSCDRPNDFLDIFWQQLKDGKKTLFFLSVFRGNHFFKVCFAEIEENGNAKDKSHESFLLVLFFSFFSFLLLL